MNFVYIADLEQRIIHKPAYPEETDRYELYYSLSLENCIRLCKKHFNTEHAKFIKDQICFWIIKAPLESTDISETEIIGHVYHDRGFVERKPQKEEKEESPVNVLLRDMW